MTSTPEISDAHENAARLIPWLVNGTLSGEEAVALRAHLAACARCRADFESEERVYEAIRAEGPLMLSGEPSFERLLARIEADAFAAPDGQAAQPWAAPQVELHEARAAEPQVVLSGIEPPVRGGDPRPAERGRSAHRAAKRRGSRSPLWRSQATVRWLAAAVLIEALGLGVGAWMWPGRGASDAAAYTSSGITSHRAEAPYRTLTTPPPRYGVGRHVRVVFRADLSLDRLQRLLQSVDAHIVDGPTEAHVYTLGFGQPLPSAAALETRLAALRADPDVVFAEPADERPP